MFIHVPSKIILIYQWDKHYALGKYLFAKVTRSLICDSSSLKGIVTVQPPIQIWNPSITLFQGGLMPVTENNILVTETIDSAFGNSLYQNHHPCLELKFSPMYILPINSHFTPQSPAEQSHFHLQHDTLGIQGLFRVYVLDAPRLLRAIMSTTYIGVSSFTRN